MISSSSHKTKEAKVQEKGLNDAQVRSKDHSAEGCKELQLSGLIHCVDSYSVYAALPWKHTSAHSLWTEVKHLKLHSKNSTEVLNVKKTTCSSALTEDRVQLNMWRSEQSLLCFNISCAKFDKLPQVMSPVVTSTTHLSYAALGEMFALGCEQVGTSRAEKWSKYRCAPKKPAVPWMATWGCLLKWVNSDTAPIISKIPNSTAEISTFSTCFETDLGPIPSLIFTPILCPSSLGTKLQGVVIEIYPYKMRHRFKNAIRHQSPPIALTCFCWSSRWCYEHRHNVI